LAVHQYKENGTTKNVSLVAATPAEAAAEALLPTAGSN